MSHRLNCLPSPGGLHLLRTFTSFFSSVFVCRRFSRVVTRHTRSSAGSATSATSTAHSSSTRIVQESQNNPESSTSKIAVSSAKSWSLLDEVLIASASTLSRSPSVASDDPSYGRSSSSQATTPTASSSRSRIHESSNSLQASSPSSLSSPSSSTTPERVVESGQFPAIVLTTPTGHRHVKHRQIKQAQQAAQSHQESPLRRPNNLGASEPQKSTRRRTLFSKRRRMFKISDLCSSPTNESSFDYDSCDETGDFDPFDFTSSASNQRALTPDGRTSNALRSSDVSLTGPEKLKVTEKELIYLNHKIEKLLIKLDEEYDTEMATSPDEECVICISAKATMQTYPCGHRVVCRRCFVKTIQMVVSQRMLPLRCVICRSRVLRLRQTTSGGFNTGHVRSHKSQEVIHQQHQHQQQPQAKQQQQPHHHHQQHISSSQSNVADHQSKHATLTTHHSTSAITSQPHQSLYRAPSATWSSNLANQTGFLCTGNTRCRSTSPRSSYKRNNNNSAAAGNTSTSGGRPFTMRLGRAPSPNYCR